MLVRYGIQQDASTSKVSLVSQPRMCHNNPQNTQTVNSKSAPEKSMLPRKVNAKQQHAIATAPAPAATTATTAAASKSQCSTVYSQPLTSILVPKCTDFRNRSLCQKSASLDYALTKVNAGQTCVETLAAADFSSSFFPTCEPKLPPRSSNQSEEER